MPIESKPMLAPFFAGEGGYCNLLHVLLTAPTPLAQAFRKVLSERVLEPKFHIQIGEAPLQVDSEVTVHPAGEESQAIDLVMYLDNDVIGVETKVFSASARKGQLAAQYRGLRECTPHGKRVHAILVFPTPTGRHTEVKPDSEGDRAESVTWSDIFDCLPRFNPVEPDVLLGAIVDQARLQFPALREQEPMTELTPERLAVKAEVDKTIDLFNRTLHQTESPLRGWTWKPHFWRDPRVDVYYGPLTGSDGRPREGQYLSLKIHFQEAGALAHPGQFRVRVSFALERKGGAKTYRAEFDTALPERMSQLPPPAGRRGTDRNGTEVFDEQWIAAHPDHIITIAGEPAARVLADLLFGYARAFSSFLLRDARPRRATSPGKVAG